MEIPGLARFRLEVEHFPREWLTVQRISHGRAAPEADIVYRWARKERKIGGGSFGTVWLERRRDENEHEHLRAVKVCDAESCPDQRELQAMMEFTQLPTSDRFVSLYGWWKDSQSGETSIAMEYFPQGDLWQYRTSMTEEDTREIMKQLLEAVDIMHQKGFTHRDIKPGNILVLHRRPQHPYWHVKLGDFGISKKVGDNSSTSLRTENRYTRSYAAPELLRLIYRTPGRPSGYTNKVDIWSLGCVFFNLLSEGRHWFDNPNPLYDEQYCNGTEPLDLELVKRDSSYAACQLLRSMLEVDPLRRTSACDALKNNWFVGSIDSSTMAGNHTISSVEIPLNILQKKGEDIEDVPSKGSAYVSSDVPTRTLGQLVQQLSPHDSKDAVHTDSNIHDVKTGSGTAELSSFEVAGSESISRESSKDFPMAKVQNNKFLPASVLEPHSDIEDSGALPSGNGAEILTTPNPKQHQEEQRMRDRMEHYRNVLKVSDREEKLVHVIARCGTPDEMRYALQMGESLEAHDMLDATPLLLAFADGSVQMVHLLLNLGQDVNHRDFNGKGAVHYAVMSEGAAKMHCFGSFLFEKLHVKDGFGRLPVHYAARHGRVAVISLIYRLGQDIEGVDRHQLTPMHYAAKAGQIDAVDILTKLGAHLDVLDMYGKTPMHDAVFQGQFKMVDKLLELGSRLEYRDKYGMTPMASAISWGQLKMVKYLEELGQKVSQSRNDGMSSLHLAALSGSRDMVEYLISRGLETDLEKKDCRGNRPIDIVYWKTRHWAMVQYLESLGSKLSLSQLRDRMTTGSREKKGYESKVWTADRDA